MKQKESIYDVMVIGGGASGMMAAVSAAGKGAHCLLIEAGNRLGRKIAITGKGRCNITNDCPIEELLDNVRRNRNFLYSSIYSLTNDQIAEYFEKAGVPTKVERGGRVFPVSDKALDVVNALEEDLISKGVTVKKNVKIKELIIDDGIAVGAVDERGGIFKARKVILACGGASYPSTGSDGNGFNIARNTGHTIIEPRGVLTGLDTEDDWPSKAMGLSLKNVKLTIREKGSNIFEMQGEMLLTHFGISGPMVLTASSSLSDSDFNDTKAFIDLKPALDDDKLNKRILRDFSKNMNRDLINSLGGLLPSKLIPIVVKISGIPEHKKVNQITSAERRKLAAILKGMELNIKGLRPVREAIVTAGGVDVKEINPSTMESLLVKNLYICGEMLDVDANTGGFNLTIAFSTGHLAGIGSAEDLP